MRSTISSISEASLLPWRAALGVNAYWLSHPFNPFSYTPFGKALAHALTTSAQSFNGVLDRRETAKILPFVRPRSVSL